MYDLTKYPGMSADRLQPDRDNPREVAFAEQWMKENDTTNGRRLLANLIAPINSRGQPDQHYIPSIRDECLAATLIQWLGSPVGMSFLSEVVLRSPEVRDYLFGACEHAEDEARKDPPGATSVMDIPAHSKDTKVAVLAGHLVEFGSYGTKIVAIDGQAVYDVPK